MGERAVSTYQQAVALKAILEARVDDLSAKLNRFPRSGPLRLTPDSVKTSLEFRTVRIAFDQAYSDLRSLNGLMSKLFRNEMAADRAARRTAFTGARAAIAKAEGR